MKANPGGDGSFSIDLTPAGRLTVWNMSVWNLMRTAQTGLTGPYAIKLQGASDRGPKSDASADASLPSLFTAIRETLGLKLENTRVPVDVMVIDSVEKPADN